MVVLLLLTGVVPVSTAQAQGALRASYTYHRPLQTDDGWRTASLQEVGMDTGRMVEFMNALARRPEHWLHSVVVIKDGRLVFEEYFPGRAGDISHLATSFGPVFVPRRFDRDSLHILASATKSVTSILLGIAIDEGLVRGTEETLLSFFPDYAQRFDSLKSRITLEHMLAMAAGLRWSEGRPYDDPRNNLTAAWFSEDPVGHLLATPIEAAPGEQFRYSSGITDLLGEVVRRRSGMTVQEFAARRLFAPLGITHFEWAAYPYAPSLAMAASSLHLRPRDMAKIGQLYLDGGVWNGTRVVSEEWVNRSTRPAVHVDPAQCEIPIGSPGYGYQWWLGTFTVGNTQTYFAAGFGGQFIFVLPAPRLVVVITAGGFDADTRNFQPMVQVVNDYVLPAAGVR